MKIPSAVPAAALALLIGFIQPALADLEISSEKQTAIEQVDALEGEIESMSMELWNYSEIALREVRSAELLASILEREGFRLERGVADMPTAFVAECRLRSAQASLFSAEQIIIWRVRSVWIVMAVSVPNATLTEGTTMPFVTGHRIGEEGDEGNYQR